MRLMQNEIVDIDPPIGMNQQASAMARVSSSVSVGMGNGINVAVRVRPFTEAEVQSKECAAVAEVAPGVLRLTPPEVRRTTQSAKSL